MLNRGSALHQATCRPGCSKRAGTARIVCSSSIRSICPLSFSSTARSAAHTGRASTLQSLQDTRRSRDHLQLVSAVPGAAGSDPSAAGDAEHTPQQGSNLPLAASTTDHLSEDTDHLDDLTADDNVILLLGSQDEDEGEEEDGIIVGQDFAAAMAAARERLMSGSGSSSSDEEWDGNEQWDTPYDQDFWSTEKERVYLVGAAYKQQYQQQQQRQQQQQQERQQRQRQSSSGTSRPRGLFDLSTNRSSSDVSAAAGSNGSGTTNSAAGAVAAAAAAVGESTGGSSSSRRQQGSQQVSYSVEESIEELGRLADTAGLQVVGSTYQVLESPNPATYIGSGKVAEVAAAVQAAQADTVLFDDELSPGQLRNLEKAFSKEQGGKQVAVADRTALILDIFSQRAQTREGKLQVELAQTEYQLPRLTRMWTHLDRVAGGGQVKGAGEKQIEIDKRLLRDKAAALRRELEAVRTHRAAHRTRRQDAPIPVAALVGYTNAGKSTLLNTLTAAGVLAEDKLFATLDPTTRKVRLEGNQEVLFSDTVGFIQKLPTQLVAAFRATLEEIAAASVVVHVLDISTPNAAAQCSAVLQVLDEIGVQDLPIITAWNKIDACPNPAAVCKLAASRADVVAVSGATGEGLEELLELVAQRLAENMIDMQVLLPYSQGALLDELHKMGKVLDTAYSEAGTLLTASVPRCLLGKLQQYEVGGSSDDTSDSSLWSCGLDADGDAGDDDGEGGVELVQGANRQAKGGYLFSGSSSSMSSV